MINAIGPTVPAMPDLDCPPWCETDHAAEWLRHVLVGRDTRPIPMADGEVSTFADIPEADWLAMFEAFHRRPLSHVDMDDGEEATVDFVYLDGETEIFLDAVGSLTPSTARHLALELLAAADALEGLTS